MSSGTQGANGVCAENEESVIHNLRLLNVLRSQCQQLRRFFCTACISLNWNSFVIHNNGFSSLSQLSSIPESNISLIAQMAWPRSKK